MHSTRNKKTDWERLPLAQQEALIAVHLTGRTAALMTTLGSLLDKGYLDRMAQLTDTGKAVLALCPSIDDWLAANPWRKDYILGRPAGRGA